MTTSPWVMACRATAVAGAAAWGAASVGAALGYAEFLPVGRATGVALALAAFAAEIVVSGLPAAWIAGLLGVPLVVAAGAVGLAWQVDPADADASIAPQTASMVALCAPFLAAAVRSLAAQPTSTWHAGVAGAVLAVCGAGATAIGAQWPPIADAVPPLTLGGVLLVAYSASDRQNLGDLAASKQVRYAGGSAVLQLLFAAICVGAYAVARRNDHTWDLTREQTHALADQTERVLGGLEFDVELVAFYQDSGGGREAVRDLTNRMRQVSSRLTVRWVDPLSNPLEAKEALVSGDHGVLLLKGNGKERRLEGEVREDELVRELLQLASDQDHVVCWLQGHGEPDPDDEEAADGYSGWRNQLEALNYEVRPVHTAAGPVPGDCELLVVARPHTDPLPHEREALVAFVAAGGRAVVMLDLFSRPEVMFDVPELSASLARFGVIVGSDAVFTDDPRQQMLEVTDPTLVVLFRDGMAPHPITSGLGSLVLPGARSVTAIEVEGLAARELVATSARAWAETDPKNPAPTPNVDIVGDVPVVAVVEVEDPAVLAVATPPKEAPAPTPDGESTAPPLAPMPGGRPKDPVLPAPSAGVPPTFAPRPGGRLVVLGDSDFASNRYLDLGNNRDLALNVVAWLADEPDQVGERATTGEPLQLTESASGLLCLVSNLVVPGITIFAAILVRLRRRSL